MSKFVLDDSKWAQFERLFALGFQAMAKDIVEEAGRTSGSRRVASSGGAVTLVNGQRLVGDGNPPRNQRAGRGVVTFAGFGSPLAHLIEFGTAPHVIVVKDKEVLASDSAVFGRTVHHPGTRARPFLTPAVLAASSRAGTYLRVPR